MKPENFKDFILNVVCKILKLIPKKRNECILLSSHIPIQNLGDQALLKGSIIGLERFSKIHVVQTGSDSVKRALGQYLIEGGKLVFAERFRIVFTSERSFFEKILFLSYVSRFSRCYAIGADVLDGTYNRHEVSIFFNLVNLISSIGVRFTIVGSSFSKSLSDETVSGLRSLDHSVKLFCRDFYSFQRVNSIFPSKLSADAAFLMPQSDSVCSYRKSDMEFLNTFGSPVIGICLKKEDFRDEAALSQFSTELLAITIRGLKPAFLFAPHHLADLEICRKIAAVLVGHGYLSVLPTRLPAADEIKSVIKSCQVVVTGRMHVAVAALSQSVVPICYSYGDKFAGLLRHFGLESYPLIVSEEDEDLVSKISLCFDQEIDLCKIIDMNKEDVLRLSKLNFEHH